MSNEHISVCEIFSKLTIDSPERRQWRCCGVVVVNFEQILHIVLALTLLTFINTGWVIRL